MSGARWWRAFPVASATGFAAALLAPALAADGPRCGAPGKPACPLQHWMRVNVAAPLARGDLGAVAEALEKVRRLNPRPKKWGNWDRIARDGAAAAREGKRRRVKSACGGCHRVYRRQYNFELRERPVEPH